MDSAVRPATGTARDVAPAARRFRANRRADLRHSRRADPGVWAADMTAPTNLRTLIAQQAAHTRWALEADRKAATQPARDGFMRRFEREVDPDGVLSAEERRKRALNARSAYMAALTRRRTVTRRRKSAAKESAA